MASQLRVKLTTARDQIRDAYRNGATLRQIGDVHEVSPGTVRNLLIEMGETLRPRGRRKHESTVDSRILNSDSATSEEGESPTEVSPAAYEGGAF